MDAVFYSRHKCQTHSNVFGMTPDIQVNAVSNATHMIVSRGRGGGHLQVQVIQLISRLLTRVVTVILNIV